MLVRLFVCCSGGGKAIESVYERDTRRGEVSSLVFFCQRSIFFCVVHNCICVGQEPFCLELVVGEQWYK